MDTETDMKTSTDADMGTNKRTEWVRTRIRYLAVFRAMLKEIIKKKMIETSPG